MFARKLEQFKRASADLRSHSGTLNSSAAQRGLRATLAGLSSAIARGVQICITFVSVPLAVHYLGNERFGLWMTIYSLIAILSFADFGLGSGLLNTVARAYGRQDVDAIQEAISSAFFSLLGLSLAMSVLFVIIHPFLNWAAIFNVHSSVARQEAGPTIAVFYGAFAVALPFGIVQRIQLAQQEGFLNGLWAILGNIASLLGLVAGIKLGLGLPWLVLAIAGGPSAALVGNSLYLFGTRPQLRPRWRAMSVRVSSRILKSGLWFFVLQISMAIGYQTDNLVIAHFVGAESVATYAVALRIFQLVPTFLGFFMLALWPAYGEAAERQDYAWIRATYRKSLLLNFLIAIPMALVLLCVSQKVIHLWVGGGVRPTSLLLIALAAYCVTSTMVGPLSAMMNGMHMLRFQGISWSLMAVLNVLLSIILTKVIGISGVAFGSAVAQGVCIIAPSIWYIAGRLRQLDGTWAVQTS